MSERKTLRLRIVVADDDPDTVRTLRLLLDISMPGMNGFEVAQKLRERYGSAKPTLIAITGRDSAADRSFARSTGFDHHVAKPYEPQQLLALIERLARPGAAP